MNKHEINIIKNKKKYEDINISDYNIYLTNFENMLKYNKLLTNDKNIAELLITNIKQITNYCINMILKEMVINNKIDNTIQIYKDIKDIERKLHCININIKLIIYFNNSISKIIINMIIKNNARNIIINNTTYYKFNSIGNTIKLYIDNFNVSNDIIEYYKNINKSLTKYCVEYIEKENTPIDKVMNMLTCLKKIEYKNFEKIIYTFIEKNIELCNSYKKINILLTKYCLEYIEKEDTPVDNVIDMLTCLKKLEYNNFEKIIYTFIEKIIYIEKNIKLCNNYKKINILISKYCEEYIEKDDTPVDKVMDMLICLKKLEYNNFEKIIYTFIEKNIELCKSDSTIIKDIIELLEKDYKLNTQNLQNVMCKLFGKIYRNEKYKKTECVEIVYDFWKSIPFNEDTIYIKYLTSANYRTTNINESIFSENYFNNNVYNDSLEQYFLYILNRNNKQKKN